MTKFIEADNWEDVDAVEWGLQWPDFTPKEMACRCGCNAIKISTRLMDGLQYLRIRVSVSVVVSSGYRCPEYNDKISGTGLDGPHTTGEAVDVKCFGELAFKIIDWGSSIFTRVGISQKGKYSSRFIHLDFLKTNWIWSY